jgi:hypothetical protein
MFCGPNPQSTVNRLRSTMLWGSISSGSGELCRIHTQYFSHIWGRRSNAPLAVLALLAFFALGHLFRGIFPPRAAPEAGFAAPRPLARRGLSALAAEAKAERAVTEGLCRAVWEEDLVARLKGEPAKLAIATRLGRETTLPAKPLETVIAPQVPRFTGLKPRC